MSITAIIIDDEKDAREVVLGYTKLFCPYIEIIGQASSYESAKKLLSTTKADLLFLDIELDKNDTMHLLAEIGLVDSNIIFITAHQTYALDAFRFDTIDYLLKPLDPDRFQQSAERAHKLIVERRKTKELQKYILKEPVANYGEKFVVSNLNESLVIQPNRLMRIHSEGSYVQLLLDPFQSIFSSKGLIKFEFLLEYDTFVKVHQSHIVNLEYCKGFVTGDKNFLLTVDGQKVPVSRRKKSSIRAYFKKMEVK